MKKGSLLTALRRSLRQADPLPILAVGYLLGLLTAIGATAFGVSAPIGTSARPSWDALAAIASAELPVFGAAALIGFTAFPALARLPLFYRSVLWGYGSLRIYLSVGQSFSYFQYVAATGLSLIPLCCTVRLTAESSSARIPPTEHLGRCLFYLGVLLLTLPLRL